jgi:hypothetical protein
MKASVSDSPPSTPRDSTLARSLKAFCRALATAEIMVLLVGAAWAGFYPDHIKRVFDASPWTAFIFFVAIFGFLVLLAALALFCGAWLVLACRKMKF